VAIVSDARGRKLGIKSLSSGLTRFRIARILGADAGNDHLMAEAMLYASVASIDGDPVPFPQSLLQLESLIDRLDFTVLRLVEKVQIEEFGIGGPAQDVVAEAKN